MKYHQTAPTGGDCTAPYDVTGYSSTAAAEFVHEVLAHNPDEWGDIEVRGHTGHVEYRDGRLLGDIPDSWRHIPIGQVKASGGWSRMDYVIFGK